MLGRAEAKSRIQREAAYWVTLIEVEHPGEQDWARFQKWLMADPAHGQAYDDVSSVWRASSELGHLAALEIPGRYAGRRGWINRTKVIFSRNSGRSGLVLGSVALLMVGLVWVFTAYFVVGNGTVYETQAAKLKQVTLADGSQVTLGARSRLNVRFTESVRSVALEQGEAFFEIEKDTERPFILAADGAIIRVVGTTFNVHDGPRGVTVGVVNGIVEVASARGSGRRPGPQASTYVNKPVHLRAGQQVLASPEGELGPVEVIDPGRSGAWKTGRLVYKNAPLGEVLADINRYSEVPVLVESPELEQLKVFASFKTTQISAVIDELAQHLPVRVDRSISGQILLKGRP